MTEQPEQPRRYDIDVNLRPSNHWPRKLDIVITDGWVTTTFKIDEFTAGELYDRIGTALREITEQAVT